MAGEAAGRASAKIASRERQCQPLRERRGTRDRARRSLAADAPSIHLQLAGTIYSSDMSIPSKHIGDRDPKGCTAGLGEPKRHPFRPLLINQSTIFNVQIGNRLGREGE